MFNALARDEVDAPSITGAEQQSSVAHRDSSRVTHFTFKNARESGDITLTDKQEKMKREMAILAQLTGVDDKLKLAILEATDEQQGKMIASLKERRAPFQWDEGGVDPFAVAAEQKRDRAIAYIEQQRKEHVALVERTRRDACARRRRGRRRCTTSGPSLGCRRRKAPLRRPGGDPSARHEGRQPDAARAEAWRARGARLRLAAGAARRSTAPRRATPAAATAAGPPLLSPRSTPRRRAARPRRLAPPPDVGASVDERHGRGGDEGVEGGAPHHAQHAARARRVGARLEAHKVPRRRTQSRLAQRPPRPLAALGQVRVQPVVVSGRPARSVCSVGSTIIRRRYRRRRYKTL